MKPPTSTISLNLKHSYAEQLPDFCLSVLPTPGRKPRMLQFNQSLADELGFDREQLTTDVAAKILSGSELPRDARPIAQAYAGHQFGSFVPQLGDGRALILGEVIDRNGGRRDIALKGSGRTPFSRGGDGRAAVGPVLREYLVGEAMHALGIPTTRALAAVATGEPVHRERVLPGAVLTRVSQSHVRVGTFQFFAARQQTEQVRQMADYVIWRHYPEIADDADPYSALLRSVIERQADLVARWMLVGFIHGVMNTDNMTISGETIDYGPCAFMDSFDPKTVFSSIDRDGRYAYSNQPTIALWNLARLAETLIPLLQKNDDLEGAVADATAILETFMPMFERKWYEGARAKLGLAKVGDPNQVTDVERKLIDDWLGLLAKDNVDFTLAWRQLAKAAEGEGSASELLALFGSQVEINAWLERWKELPKSVPSAKLASTIRACNPVYIPRNHLVEEALTAASDEGDLVPFEKLLGLVQAPFVESPDCDRYALPASADFTACYRTFCGT